MADGGRESVVGEEPSRSVDSHSGKLKVFISYSRRDLDFADQLGAILEWQGFLVSIDRKGIHGAENWETRLGNMILEADTIIFVLSPDSAASDICKWEVEEAARRGKRPVPVLCRPLDGAMPHDLPRDLNYIHFYAEPDVPGSGFGTGQRYGSSMPSSWMLGGCVNIRAWRNWRRAGRRTGVRPTYWSAARNSEGYQAWRDRRPTNAPSLTALRRAFAWSERE